MTKVRVLVVEDSLTIRKRLIEVLEEAPNFEVVGEAEDGRQAIERCMALKPDAVTMDMMLPVMTGLAATEYIMAHCPTPILVVSASFNRGEVFRTYDALAAGAVEVIEKPTGQEAPGDWEREFLSTLKIVSRVRVITHPRARLNGISHEPKEAALTLSPKLLPSTEPRPIALLALGASTGGPNALVEVLRSLPKDLTAPVLVVLHIGAPFAPAFGEWMGAQISRPVSYAQGGEIIRTLGRRVVFAPPDRHLVVRAGRLELTDDPERHSCKPSVDVMFESIAREYGPEAAAGLLTGMGRDGASGLLALRRSGAATIAQDEATSIIYGMPREAALLGAADRILPLGEIGPALGDIVRARGQAP
ncbi:MAG TPA: chemotaxis-specific protein-glutamate methyltransferase CheB [Polyangiaceae bacterium]|nr:chemotaxis-specific protein-glutamate methyltransferase CheB [Polyangiaceae bacterium]